MVACGRVYQGSEFKALAWWAVHCWEGGEFKVRDRLTRAGIESFLPYERSTKLVKALHGRVSKIVHEVAVFPGYLFACAAPGRVKDIRDMYGVCTVVNNKSQPLEVTDRVMDRLKALAKSPDGLMYARDAARLSEGFRFARGDRFKFGFDSAFSGFIGVLQSLERLDDTGYVTASVELLGGVRDVDVHHSLLRPLVGTASPA